MTKGRMSSGSVLTTSTLDLIARINPASSPSGEMYLLKPFVRMTCAMAIPMTDPSNWMQDAIPVACMKIGKESVCGVQDRETYPVAIVQAYHDCQMDATRTSSTNVTFVEQSFTYYIAFREIIGDWMANPHPAPMRTCEPVHQRIVSGGTRLAVTDLISRQFRSTRVRRDGLQ